MSAACILLADDYSEWRRQVRAILQARPEWRIIGEATNGLQAVQKVAELRPDIVLLDIGLPLLNGIDVAQRIRQSSPSTRIVFVTQNNDADIIVEALATGADGYVLKPNAESELIPAIEVALKDGHGPDAGFCR